MTIVLHPGFKKSKVPNTNSEIDARGVILQVATWRVLNLNYWSAFIYLDRMRASLYATSNQVIKIQGAFGKK